MIRKKKELPGLNTASMADVSFLLLTFFLLTSSINTDLGIQRRLPPLSNQKSSQTEIHKRNIFSVKVNSSDQLFFDGQIGDINDLKQKAKEFLLNKQNLPNLPEKERIYIPLIGKYYVSKGVISIQNDRGTSYDMYFKVQNELTAAIAELKDELSRERFGRDYKDCKYEQKEAIDKAIPNSISEAEPKKVGGEK
jgi:biopolymer transport protein ExbD